MRRIILGAAACAAMLNACGSRVQALERPLDGSVDGAVDSSRPDASAEGSVAPVPSIVVESRDIESVVGCELDQWCWESPLPQGESVRVGFATAEDDQWLFGVSGMALRYDGTRWRSVATLEQANAIAAWGSASDDLWLLGAREDREGRSLGRVLQRWDGARFSLAPALAAGLEPQWVHGSSRQDVWVVARAGGSGDHRVFRLVDGAWSELALSASLSTVTGLWVESPTRAWLTGVERGSSAKAWRWDGARWSAVGSLDALGQQRFVGGPVVFGGAAYALATDEREVSVVRLRDNSVELEAAPERAATATLTVSGGSLWFLPALRGTASVYRKRAQGGPWTRATAALAGTEEPWSVLVSGSSAGAWIATAGADLYRLRDGAEAGTVTLESAAARPTLRAFVSHYEAPREVLTTGASTMVRDAVTTQWSARTNSDSRDVLQLDDSLDQRLALAVSSGGALSRVTPTGMSVIPEVSGVQRVFSRAADRAAAVGGAFAWLFDGARWTRSPMIVPPVGSALELWRIELGAVAYQGETVFVGGGSPRSDLRGEGAGILCRLRLPDLRCVETPERGAASARVVLDLVYDGSSALTALIGSATDAAGATLYRIDPETMAFTAVQLTSGPGQFSLLRYNKRSGRTIALDTDQYVTVFEQDFRRATRYRVPLSYGPSRVRDLFVADDERLWVLRDRAEILRLTPGR